MSKKAEPKSEAREENPDVHSWRFWKKRLARASIVGAAVLLTTQLLPAIPEDQRIEIHAPDEFELIELGLSYGETRDGPPLGGTRIQPNTPTTTFVHKFKLASGDYFLNVKAQLGVPGTRAAPQFLDVTSDINLNGSTQVIRLEAPLPPPKSKSAR